jgi:hypothetical protein
MAGWRPVKSSENRAAERGSASPDRLTLPGGGRSSIASGRSRPSARSVAELLIEESFQVLDLGEWPAKGAGRGAARYFGRIRMKTWRRHSATSLLS